MGLFIKCNLGKVKIETMLASGLSHELRVNLGLFRATVQFYSYPVEVKLFLYVLSYILFVLKCSRHLHHTYLLLMSLIQDLKQQAEIHLNVLTLHTANNHYLITRYCTWGCRSTQIHQNETY